MSTKNIPCIHIQVHKKSSPRPQVGKHWILYYVPDLEMSFDLTYIWHSYLYLKVLNCRDYFLNRRKQALTSILSGGYLEYTTSQVKSWHTNSSDSPFAVCHL